MKRTDYTQLLAALCVVAVIAIFKASFSIPQFLEAHGHGQIIAAFWIDCVIAVLSGGLVAYLTWRENIELHHPPTTWWKQLFHCVAYGIAFFILLRILFIPHWYAVGFGAMLAGTLVKI